MTHFPYSLISFITLLFTGALHSASLQLTPIDSNHYTGLLTISLDSKDYLYADYLDVSVDHPALQITSWHVNQESVVTFDRSFKEHKKAYKGPVTIALELKCEDPALLEKAHMHVSYYQSSKHQLMHDALPLQQQPQNKIHTDQQLNTSVDVGVTTPDPAHVPIQHPGPLQTQPISWYEYFSNLLLTTQSGFLQIFLIFMLGLLMSLTPCIYPMIPITAGILQAQGSRSVIVNFFLSFAYVMGMAVTFAILGLMAAFAGTALGSLMTKPLFIIPIVALLAYLAFALLGFYEMYIPRFMQPKHRAVGAGSFVSAFVFGIISGSVASPCLSPGLVLLLSLVAALQNTFLGFLYLFIFGLGLGVPLIIIGTFSSSLNVLPRAGMWMIEIKKLFGLLLIAMCFYFLSYIIQAHILLWPLMLFVLAVGSWYLYSAQITRSRLGKLIQTVIGIALVATSVFLVYKSYRATLAVECPITESMWYSSYECARDIAVHEQKLLFVDVGAPACSLCTALDRTLFSEMLVLEEIAHFTPVKIDGSLAENKPFLKQYGIFGFPAVLIIDPKTEIVIKKWGPELYGIKPEVFIAQLEELV